MYNKNYISKKYNILKYTNHTSYLLRIEKYEHRGIKFEEEKQVISSGRTNERLFEYGRNCSSERKNPKRQRSKKRSSRGFRYY